MGRRAPTPALRARFWVVALIVVPANLLWVVRALSVNRTGPWFDECPLLANVVLILMVLAGLNAVLRKLRPNWAISQSELLLLYTALAISTTFAGSCYGQGLALFIAHPYRYGQPEFFGAGALYDARGFLHYLPTWLIISNPETLQGFWEGGASADWMKVAQAWSVPILAWTGFTVALFCLTMCLNILVRQRWVRHERLTFPIVWLPLEMTRPSSGLFRQPLMWLGFGLAFAPEILNGLNHYYPALPVIPIKAHSVMGVFRDRPWNAMDALTISFQPFMIGLGFLLPQDLLFSSWFFHLFWQAERVASAAVGFTPEQQQVGFPHIVDQAFGAALAIGALALWGTRGHLAAAWRRALGLCSAAGVDDSTEAFSYRVTFIGLALSAAVVIAFLLATGMSFRIAVVFLALFLTMLVAITRIRAESGGPLLDMFYYLSPPLMLTKLAGSAAFSPRDLTAMSLQNWHTWIGFNQPMPYGLEALKIADESRRAQRRFFVAAVVAALVGMLGSIVVEMHYAYKLGEATMRKDTWGESFIWRHLQTWVSEPNPVNPGAGAGVLAGAGFTVFLAIMRTRLIGWPFHPVPLAVTAGWGVYVGFFWFPFLIAWVLKLLILRYKGRDGFSLALPFFLGLILGDMTGGMMWSVYAAVSGKIVYSFFGA